MMAASQGQTDAAVDKYWTQIQEDLRKIGDKDLPDPDAVGPSRPLVGAAVRALMNRDMKCTGLKTLQGHIWKGCYEQGLVTV